MLRKFPCSKFKSGLLTRTICPRGCPSHSFNVLMSNLNCKKDSLLGQTVLVKRALSNFERGHLLLYSVHPLVQEVKVKISLAIFSLSSSHFVGHLHSSEFQCRDPKPCHKMITYEQNWKTYIYVYMRGVILVYISY